VVSFRLLDQATAMVAPGEPCAYPILDPERYRNGRRLTHGEAVGEVFEWAAAARPTLPT
jgi:hypothetical protein